MTMPWWWRDAVVLGQIQAAFSVLGALLAMVAIVYAWMVARDQGRIVDKQLGLMEDQNATEKRQESIQASQAEQLQQLGAVAQRQLDIAIRQIIAAAEMRMYTERGFFCPDAGNLQVHGPVGFKYTGALPVALGKWSFTVIGHHQLIKRVEWSLPAPYSAEQLVVSKHYTGDGRLGWTVTYEGAAQMAIEPETSFHLGGVTVHENDEVAIGIEARGLSCAWRLETSHKTFVNIGFEPLHLGGDCI